MKITISKEGLIKTLFNGYYPECCMKCLIKICCTKLCDNGIKALIKEIKGQFKKSIRSKDVDLLIKIKD